MALNIMMLVVSLMAAIAAAEVVEVTVDPRASTPFEPYWKRSFGSGHAALGLRPDWQAALARAVKDYGLAGIRQHGIFDDDMNVVRLGGKDNATLVFNWTSVDTLWDAHVLLGVKPLVELGFMPYVLANCSSAVAPHPELPECLPNAWVRTGIPWMPRRWGDWHQLVAAAVAHAVARYGLGEVRQWHFEVWNEQWGVPGSSEETLGTYVEDLYNVTARAVRSVDGELRVGGPAQASQLPLAEFVARVEGAALPLDFVSSHQYGNPRECPSGFSADTDLDPSTSTPRQQQQQQQQEPQPQQEHQQETQKQRPQYHHHPQQQQQQHRHRHQHQHQQKERQPQQHHPPTPSHTPLCANPDPTRCPARCTMPLGPSTSHHNTRPPPTSDATRHTQNHVRRPRVARPRAADWMHNDDTTGGETTQTRVAAVAQAGTEPTAKVQARMKAEATTKAKAEAEVETKAKAKAKAEAEAKPKANAKAEAEAEGKPKAEAEAKARAEAQVKAKGEARATPKAEAKATTEAKAHAEYEEKVEALAQEKAKTEVQAKATAEAEAKAKAEVEQKTKFEAEVEAKTEAAAEAEVNAKAAAEDYCSEGFDGDSCMGSPAEIYLARTDGGFDLAADLIKSDRHGDVHCGAAGAEVPVRAKAEERAKAKAEMMAKDEAEATTRAEAELKAMAEAEANRARAYSKKNPAPGRTHIGH